MPTSIPYDPSLVLGNIVHPNALAQLDKLAQAQAPIDAAQEKLDSYIEMKRSLDMTINELMNMNVDPSAVIDKNGEVADNIGKSAAEYATARLAGEDEIQKIKAQLKIIHADEESPIDYNRTQLKKMPLSADSLKFDAQYFSFDENQQSSQSMVAKIRAYVSQSTSFLGNSISKQAAGAAETQLNRQLENHQIAGTLVLTAGCTHKDALLLAPFILDVDKGIRVWNKIFSDNADKIKTDKLETLQQIAQEEGTDKEKSISILSGATYGSSFVGMVHILRTESTQSSQTMASVAASLQTQFKVGGWFAKESGGFGVDSSFATDIKNLLSSQNVSSHASLIAMGSIPSIKSNQVQIGVKTFADFDPAKMMNNLATLANATSADKTTVDQSASAARTGAQMLAIQGSTVQNVMLGLAQIDDGANKVLDVNSMMTAFEDYVNKAIAGNIGVPINYYLKPITRAQLAQMWVAKYYPGEYLAISGDDAGNSGGGSSNNSQPANSN